MNNTQFMAFRRMESFKYPLRSPHKINEERILLKLRIAF